MITVGSLCTGYGGLEMALWLAGWPVELAWVADNDKAAGRLLAHRHPGVPNLGDITTVDWHSVESVDLVAAGFPCTDISCAGQLAGMGAGTRSGVWTHVAKAIGVLRPSLVVIENVEALLSTPANRSDSATDGDLEPGAPGMGDRSSRSLRALGAVLGDLANLGFDAEWTRVSAASVGAPHRRNRIFILAWPADATGDAWQILNRDGGAAANGTGVGHGDGRPESIGWVPAATVAGGVGAESLSLLPTPNAALGRGTGFPSTTTAQERFDRGTRCLDDAVALLPTPNATDAQGGPRAVPERRTHGGTDHGPRLRDVAPLLPTPTVADARGSRNATADRSENASTAWSPGWSLSDVVYAQRWGQYAPAIARWEQVIGRPAPSPTEPGAKGQPRLSPLFVEWLMGLPEGHVTAVPGLKRNEQLARLGNGIVPLQGAFAVIELAARVLPELARAATRPEGNQQRKAGDRS